MNAKRRLYDEIVVSTAQYRAETWNLGAAERKTLNVTKLKCLRSRCEVTQSD